MTEITLQDFRDAIDDMYGQLNPDQIDHWPVNGMEIWIQGERFVIGLEAAE